VDAYIESGGGAEEWEPLRLHVPLLGAHQVENAATAYSALVVARNRGLPITEAAIRQGFADVIWPGRFELLSRVPPLVIDSAHNRDSALKLRLAIDDYFPSLPVILVFGASQDKDIKGMFKELLPRVRQVIATRSIHPRSIDPDILVDLAHQFGSPARAVPTVEEALEEALRLAESEAVIVVTGSLFVAAGVRAAWLERYGGIVGTGVANIEG
jgi:dihydrofolate synthase/folylpolyglutamate synthase